MNVQADIEITTENLTDSVEVNTLRTEPRSWKDNDSRLFLKIKLINLADEARLIRKFERKRPVGSVSDGLRVHRRTVVSHAARLTHVAYGLLRGRTFEQMEGSARPVPAHVQTSMLKEIMRMLIKYGPRKWNEREELLAKVKAELQATKFFQDVTEW